jgi:WD40 repeat protein/serine/threonine protein kinase/tetratricopeptide (TPR) repeat protein
MSASSADRNPVEQLAEEFAERQRRGEYPAISEYTAKYPQWAEQIRDLFPALALMEQLKPRSDATGAYDGAASLAGDQKRERLGDYRILREVGRGGMGIVYEAEQESLGRRVALKVFPFHQLSGTNHLERFRREAKAAGRLHHTNIVPVFGVGESDGLHYYAMQFINGEGLDKVVEDLRRFRDQRGSQAPGPVPETANRTGMVAQGLLTGRFALAEAGANEPNNAASVVAPAPPAGLVSPSPTNDSTALSGSCSELSGRSDWEYCRNVARIGLQVAEALAYAHKQGILHRDIKPSNLLLDMQGTVWVTDFGLAKAEGTEELTHTGDIVGTLRFMAPERFNGKSLPQSDVYGLGLTLYELLTLRPAFEDAHRARLIEQVMHQEPAPPRKLDPRIPHDLETIVLKALAKDPEQRYATADQLAEDLRRFLADRPIQARRAPWRERAWRWCRRNPAVAALLAAVALALVLGTAVASFFAIQANDSAAQARAKEEQARQEKRAADDARQDAVQSRNRALRAGEDLRANLYYAEMNLAGQAAELPGGLSRINQLLAHWRPTAGGPDRRGWEWYYLRGLGQRSLLTLHRHTAPVPAVSWSPDGRRLASAGGDGMIKIWDTTTGRELATLRGHRGSLSLLAWSPDGRRLASSGEPGTILLWDPDTGQVTARLPRPSPKVRSLSWAPDSRRLVSIGYYRTVRLWDADTGRQTDVFRGPTRCEVASWSPDGRLIALAGEGPKVLLRDTQSKRETILRTGHTGWIRALSWDPRARLLASGSAGGVIRLGDVAGLREVGVLRGHTGAVTSVAWGPDGCRLASASTDQTVRVWDVKTQKETATLRGHTSGVNGITWSPDGRRLASAGNDQTVRVWEMGTGPDPSLLRGPPGSLTAVSWGPDSRRLASAGVDGTIRVWDADAGKQLAVLSVPTHRVSRTHSHSNAVCALGWSPDGRRLASGGQDGSLRLWDVATRKGTTLYSGDDNIVNAVSWNPDGRRLASWDYSMALKVWDTNSGKLLLTLYRSSYGVSALSWGPGGRRLASGEGDGTVRLWDVDGRRQLARLRGHAGAVTAVSWSRHGRRLATASTDQTIKIWDVRERRELVTLRGLGLSVYSVSWSSDGRRLASASSDNTLKLWDTETGRETLSLRGHASEVSGVSWSPDGRRLASSGNDGTVRVWDVTPGFVAERSPLLLPELDRRLRADPRRLADLNLRAEIQARQGRWEPAAADWSCAARLQGDKAPRWFEAGWWVADPFPTPSAPTSELGSQPDPLRPIPGKGSGAGPRRWQPAHASANGCLDLGALFPNDTSGSVAALLRVYAPQQQPVVALVGATGAHRVRLNGSLLHEARQTPSPEAADKGVPLTLRAGWNTLLFELRLGKGANRLSLWLSAEPADRAGALADQGRWEEALSVVKQMQARQPNQPDTLLLAGRLFRRHADHLRATGQPKRAAGQEREARARYEKLLALRPDHAGYAADFADFLLSRAGYWEVLRPMNRVSAGGTTLTPKSDGSILASGKNPLPETYTITARTRLTCIRAVRLELLPDPSLPGDGPGRGPGGNLVLNELRITAAPEGHPDKARPVGLYNAWADHSQDGFPVAAAIDGDGATGWAQGPEHGRAHVAVFEVKEPIPATSATILTFTLEQRHKHLDTVHNIGRFRLSVTAQPQARWQAILTRQSVSAWTKLGAAHYLRGEWQAALGVLRKATASPAGGIGWDRLLLTLTHARLGQHHEARKWSNRFLAWMAKKSDDEWLWHLAADSLPGWLARPPQPDSAEVRLGRARAFLFLNLPEKALLEATWAVELQPKDVAVWQTRGDIHLRLKKWDEALADYGKAVALKPDDHELRNLRANLAAGRGKWAVAAEDFAILKTADDFATSWRPWYRHALTLLADGKTEEYRKACAAMLEHFKDTGDMETEFFTAWTCALAPDAVPDWAPVLKLAERAVGQDAQDARALMGVGAILYRAGQLKESVKYFHAARAAAHCQDLTSHAYLDYFLAMAYHRLENEKEAGEWLDKAVAQADKEIRARAGNVDLEMWVRQPTLQLLGREAEALLGAAAPRPQK